MKNRYEQIILGAGASGLMLASLLEDGSDILLLEGNNASGAKIAISGGGRCNLTNRYVKPSHFLGDASFVSQVLARWDQSKVLEWFAKRGLTTTEEKNHQFFCTHSSRQILDIFAKETRGVESRYACQIKSVTREDEYFVVDATCGRFEARRLVVATGGLSYPKLGATDIGYQIAEKFGHTITTPAPALVGMTLQPDQFFFKDLSGISTEVNITIGEEKVQGQLLFAHKGISGPAVLDASVYWKKGQIEIDFLPSFDWNIIRDSKKNISTLLPMPKRLSKAFLGHFKIPDQPARSITSANLDKLKSLHAYAFAPAGTFGYGKAEVTRGGVSTTEIDSKTMESKLALGLYFMGEVLDITGRLGGYNLQWAFSSAAVCADAMK